MERRKSRDVWARLFLVVNFAAWLVLFAAMLVFHFAQPEFETLFDRFYRLNLRTYWDSDFIRYLAYTLGMGLAVSLTGMVLGLFRARRSTDHRNPIIVLGVLYLILFFIYWYTV